MEQSTLAKALKRLFDDTGFTRDTWARMLQVPESSILEWVDDKSIPRSDLLRVTIDILRNSAGVPSEILTEFDDIIQKPAHEISPLYEYIGRTLNSYLDERLRDFANRLECSSISQQLRILKYGCVGPDLK